MKKKFSSSNGFCGLSATPPPNATMELSNLGEGGFLPQNSMLLALGGIEGGWFLA